MGRQAICAKIASVGLVSLQLCISLNVISDENSALTICKNNADVLAYRPRPVVEAERRLGFTHSHNDNVNWDTFDDGCD